jgi:hypothetical protein
MAKVASKNSRARRYPRRSLARIAVKLERVLCLLETAEDRRLEVEASRLSWKDRGLSGECLAGVILPLLVHD